MNALRTATVDVTVVTSGHDVADARLHREVAALRARGLTVEVLGLGAATNGPAGAAVRTWQRSGMAARALLALRQPFLARGRVILALDPDSGLATCLVARVRGRRSVADVHEDYAALLGDRDWAKRWGGIPGMVGQALVRSGLRVFERADLVVVADEHVPPPTARQRLVVRNLPDTSMLPEPGPRSAVPRAFYIGDLRRSRGLFAMVEAVRRAPGWELDLVGPVAAADEEDLRRLLAQDPELSGRVCLHGRRPPAEAWRCAEGAWVGLMLLEPTPAFNDAVPSKLYEYVGCGVPVITTDLPRPAELVTQGQAGAVVAGGTDIEVGERVAEVLRSWSADPEPMDRIRERLAQEAQITRSRPTPYEELADRIVDLLGRS
ncbi:Glycosyltransferase involved in cell wall bisynthesis [Austwickia chelonae]|uniref:Putative glycosyltransferase n=1 Tax=Austwickia chelonae NBRC 105200 TaxID=1184607 RepID=K6VN01_9MICO|nr:glycosyltransferase [Austwickia chelonae]GAB76755.1 putative glycosyltransferase [Austwickia chelonae NBRC 105200]SEW30227.1 Glycosyltransferase involved in cell wall bisynthesis [Austwickia chelonae]